MEVKQVWHAEVQRTHDDRTGGQEGVKQKGREGREREERHLGDMLTPSGAAQRRAPPYLRGDPMREVGGVGLLPALWRRRTACRRNVLRSRRNMTVSSLPGAVVARDITGRVSLTLHHRFRFSRREQRVKQEEHRLSERRLLIGDVFSPRQRGHKPDRTTLDWTRPEHRLVPDQNVLVRP